MSAGRSADEIRAELASWASQNGKVLIDRDEHEELCAAYAEAIVELTDLDVEYLVLLGDA